MAYDPHLWQNGEALTVGLLNHIEMGIQEALKINNYEAIANKVQEITDTSSEEQYPSAKAVYNLFHNIPNASNLTYPRPQ